MTDRLTTTETEMLVRWFLYHADRPTLDLLREEMPVFMRKAWAEYIVKAPTEEQK